MNKKKSDFANSLHDVMQTKAFSEISIADVCEGLNCSRQSFYYYFKSLKECLAYYIRNLAKAKIKEDHMITDTFAFWIPAKTSSNSVKQIKEPKICFGLF